MTLLLRIIAFIIDFILALIVSRICIQTTKFFVTTYSLPIDIHIVPSYVFLFVLPILYGLSVSSKYQATPGHFICALHIETRIGNQLKLWHAIIRFFLVYGPLVGAFAHVYWADYHRGQSNLPGRSDAPPTPLAMMLPFILLLWYGLGLYNRIGRTRARRGRKS